MQLQLLLDLPATQLPNTSLHANRSGDTCVEPPTSPYNTQQMAMDSLASAMQHGEAPICQKVSLSLDMSFILPMVPSPGPPSTNIQLLCPALKVSTCHKHMQHRN